MVAVTQLLGRGSIRIEFLEPITCRPQWTYECPPDQALELAGVLIENGISMKEKFMKPDHGVTQKRIDDRVNGCDEERSRIRDLQDKGPLTEGERMELHVLLARRYPARPPVATF